MSGAHPYGALQALGGGARDQRRAQGVLVQQTVGRRHLQAHTRARARARNATRQGVGSALSGDCHARNE
jgi:hypothetical protein